MKYISTKNPNSLFDMRQAVLHGLAPDGGLFMPVKINQLSKTVLRDFKDSTFQQIAFQIARQFLDSVPKMDLQDIIDRTITFDAPLVKLGEQLSVMELFHGPTLAFKDFGARFLSEMVNYYTKDSEKEILILVATSGDTGSAVAHGFYGHERIKVMLLYPGGKISKIQEQQLTILGKNIQAFEVEGTFDDCQKMVKNAFLDPEINKKYSMTSANSINIARLLPQSFYYFYAWAQSGSEDEIIFSVPCGNFGNLTAGILAWKMGLPVKKFIAAVNSNRVFTRFLETGNFKPQQAVRTLSNAMDVGLPSNFERILHIFGHNTDAIRDQIVSFSISDDQTRIGMKEVYRNFNYLIDPHGAVGYMAYKQYIKQTGPDCQSVILETAHPAKFIDVMDPSLFQHIKMPERLAKCLDKKKQAVRTSSDYHLFRKKMLEVLE